jgi:hypothetical protein
MWFFACLSLAAAEPARAEPAPTDPAPADPAALPEKRFSWVAIPNFGYDVDDGFGAGARAELDWYAPGYDPYQLAFVTQAYLTTNGYHHHRVRFDAPGLGADHRLRLSGHFAYRQWLNDGYWGMGNDTTLTQASVEDPDQAQYYRYTLVQPFGRLTLRGELGGPWAWFAFLAGRWSSITTYEGSLLEAEAPLGMAGGWGIQPGVGMLYDTREPELTPDGGVLAELAVRGMPKLPGADGEWISVFASLRGFVTLGPRVVIASRLMGEASFGDVPFYDLNTWGGLVPTMGFGGADSIRGVNFGRWRDRNKLCESTCTPTACSSARSAGRSCPSSTPAWCGGRSPSATSPSTRASASASTPSWPTPSWAASMPPSASTRWSPRTARARPSPTWASTSSSSTCSESEGRCGPTGGRPAHSAAGFSAGAGLGSASFSGAGSAGGRGTADSPFSRSVSRRRFTLARTSKE